MELGSSEFCSKAGNDTIEIIKCQTKDSDVKYFFDEQKNLIESSSEPDQIDKNANAGDLFIVKFNLNTCTTCCRVCNQLHPLSSEYTPIDRRLSLMDSINYKANSKMNACSTLNKTASFNFGHGNNQSDPIKKLIENMKNFQSMGQNFEIEIKKSYDVIRKKILNSFQNNLLKKLNENYSILVKELEDFEKKCLLNVNKNSQFWKEMENLINANDLDSETIQYYLDNEHTEPNESTISLIEEFTKLLDIKLKEFNSYILMDKKISLKQNPNFKIDETSFGFLSCSQLETSFSYQEHSSETNNQDFFHLDEIKDEKDTKLKLVSELDLSEKINIDENNFKYVSVYTLDSLDSVILCVRYGNSSSNDMYTDFYLINSDGFITKSFSASKGIVRCISTNSSHVLFTLESYQNESNKSFELNLYDSELDLTKNLKIVDTNNLVEANSSQIFPISVFLNDEKIFIFKNTLPFINVYDMNLNILTILGQDINSNYKFFIKRNHNFMCVNSSTLYTSQVTANGTTVTALDLNTGFSLLEVEIENYFTNFYVLSQSKIKNEIFFVCSCTKKMIVYDLKSKKNVIFVNASQENESITSYCLNKFGFLVTILSNTLKISVF